MHTIRKIIISIFIFGSSITMTHFTVAITTSEDTRSTHQLSDAMPTDYDDFDSLANDMVDMGVVAEEPKPISTIDRWVQQLCSPIIMKYVLLKGYMRNWCYWIVGVKKNIR